MVNNTVLMLCEHQSTINENMPLRFFFYAAHLYEKLIDEKARFEKKMHPIAKPEFYVFYNGKQNLPSVSTLNISDAFLQKDNDIPIELKVTVFNLNELAPQLAKSKTLKEYATFVKIVEEIKTEDEDSFTQAIERCIREGILSDYLKRNTKEVHNMFFGEYDREMDIRVQRAEEREIALAEGSHNRNIEIAKQMLLKNFLLNDICDITSLSLDEIEALREK